MPIFGSLLSPPSPLDQNVNGAADGAFATYTRVGWLGLLIPIQPMPSFCTIYKDSSAVLGMVMYPHMPLNLIPQLLDAVVGSSAAWRTTGVAPRQ